ncbi:rod shape-determining protein RodA [Pseudomarimonas arenosa]|uniref:Peptidoglycan glycosyltransferase MrdB n=1 Tax=Pseudomarimonas arenosa TaxID=2774145 RepID=A0AAW3ZH94_9GAMM|nr:rod shape-determining protein RodA [Pseudomarimonas arenosa]MBD8525173.1 rod shape-determining protein RodA [Pseudomarimonas arenosa]
MNLSVLGGLIRRFATPRLDLPLAGALLLLMALSLTNLYSAAGGNTGLVISQALRFAVGFAALWVLSRIPPLQLRLWAPWIFAGGLLLLALVPVLGTGRSGRHWLNLGVVFVQPSEFLKLAVPMALAAFLHSRVLPPTWRDLALAAVIIGLPTGLILLQPDLGTALLVASSGVFVIYLAGINWQRIMLLSAAGLSLAPVGWLFLREYQRDRLRTFLNPEADPLGAGWNIIQSKIAVGSGGLWGKGWLQGTQSRLEFLPEHTTDFILAVYAEEFGLVGVAALLALYLFIIGRCLWIAANARETWSRLTAGAIGLSLSVYVVVNGGMVSGLLPVVGVPMPLLSFGGTSAVTLLAGFGVVMSIHAHRKFMG